MQRGAAVRESSGELVYSTGEAGWWELEPGHAWTASSQPACAESLWRYATSEARGEGVGGVEPLSPAKKNIAVTASRGHSESASREALLIYTYLVLCQMESCT